MADPTRCAVDHFSVKSETLSFRSLQYQRDLPSHLRFGNKKSIQIQLLRNALIALVFSRASQQENINDKTDQRFIQFYEQSFSCRIFSSCCFPSQQLGQDRQRTFQVAEESRMKVRTRCGFRENKAAFLPRAQSDRGVESRAAPSEVLNPKWPLSSR